MKNRLSSEWPSDRTQVSLSLFQVTFAATGSDSVQPESCADVVVRRCWIIPSQCYLWWWWGVGGGWAGEVGPLGRTQFKPIRARGSGGHASALRRAAGVCLRASSKCLFTKVQPTSSLHLRRLSSLASSANMEWGGRREAKIINKISLAGPKVGQTISASFQPSSDSWNCIFFSILDSMLDTRWCHFVPTVQYFKLPHFFLLPR